MKRICYLLLISFAFVSCEDVIEVDLPPTDTRLIVDGLIRVDISQEFVPVEIKIGQTDDFFGNVTPVSGINEISIQIVVNEGTTEEGSSFKFLAEVTPGSGIYEPDPTFDTDQRIRSADVLPGMRFNLFFVHEGKRYFATTTYAESVPIDFLRQGDETLFDEDDIELEVGFTDDGEADNFYIFDFDNDNFLTTEDTFYQGQQFQFSYFYDDDLQVGQEVEVSILGADRNFYNYMNLLLEQTEEDFGVFETPAATIRGNVFEFIIDNMETFDNTGDPDAFALGYFAFSQEFKSSIVIE